MTTPDSYSQPPSLAASTVMSVEPDYKTVHLWIDDAFRLLTEIRRDSGRGGTRALGISVQAKMAQGMTPSDFLDYRLATEATGADEVELLMECALSFLMAAKVCVQHRDPFAAMNHLIMTYQAIGMATPIAADLAIRRLRAEEPWSDLLKAVKAILKNPPKRRGFPDRWNSIEKAVNALAEPILKANEKIKEEAHKKSTKQKFSDDPVQLVKKWARKGGLLEFEIKRVFTPRTRPLSNAAKHRIHARGFLFLRNRLGFPEGAK